MLHVATVAEVQTSRPAVYCEVAEGSVKVDVGFATDPDARDSVGSGLVLDKSALPCEIVTKTGSDALFCWLPGVICALAKLMQAKKTTRIDQIRHMLAS